MPFEFPPVPRAPRKSHCLGTSPAKVEFSSSLPISFSGLRKKHDREERAESLLLSLSISDEIPTAAGFQCLDTSATIAGHKASPTRMQPRVRVVL